MKPSKADRFLGRTSRLHPRPLLGIGQKHTTILVCASKGLLVVRDIAAAFETLHLPRLQLAQVLLAQVNAADLVAHNICLDVLLRLGL